MAINQKANTGLRMVILTVKEIRNGQRREVSQRTTMTAIDSHTASRGEYLEMMLDHVCGQMDEEPAT